MSSQKLTDQIELYRSMYHQLIDAYMDALILHLTAGDLSAHLKDENEHYLPLSSAARCRGIRPIAVVLPDGERVETSTWTEAAAEILKDCAADPLRYQLLTVLSEHAPGSSRQLLALSPDKLDAPLKISDDLYLEGKFDTQVLMDDLVKKILRRVDYDHGSVAVLYRDPEHGSAIARQGPEEAPASPAGPTM